MSICKCRKSAGITPPKTSSTSFLRNPLKRYIGLELEFTHLNHSMIYGAWPVGVTVVTDGSVNGDGRELVVSPFNGDMFYTKAYDLCTNYLTTTEVDSSCGYHVHIDGYDLDAFSLRRLLCLYAKFQPIFYTIVDPARRHCHYGGMYKDAKLGAIARLKTCKTPAELRQSLMYFIYGDSPMASTRAVKGFKSHKYHDSRYAGLNLHSWMYRKTIEFRMHEGTNRVKQIIPWAIWCGWFVELATRLTDSEEAQIKTPLDLLNVKIERSFSPAWGMFQPSAKYPEQVNLRTWMERQLAHIEILDEEFTPEDLTESIDIEEIPEDDESYDGCERIDWSADDSLEEDE